MSNSSPSKSKPSSPTTKEEEKQDHSSNYPLLYASYFFAAWGDRMWEFAAIVFLMQIFPTSLFPSSLFGFAENIAGISLGGWVGRFIDSNDRLTVVRTSIIGQNVVIFIASVIFVIALTANDEGQKKEASQVTSSSVAANKNATSATVDSGDYSKPHFFFLQSATTSNLLTLALIVFAGMVAKVTSSMNKISIHKDWSVVLAAGDSVAQTIINTNMRRVDLSCAILAPLAVGVLSSAMSPSFSLKFIAAWSFVSFFIELHLSSKVYNEIPALQKPKAAKKATASSSSPPNAISSRVVAKSGDEEIPEDSIYRAYLRHPIFPVSLAYCLLYISALSFGGIMIAYLRTRGCSDALLALGRGLAALVAIGSTFAVPEMIKSLGLVNAGKVSTWSQVAALAPLAFVFYQSTVLPLDQQYSNTTFITIIFISICLSRFGLWAFDLCQTQLMQESVDLRYAGRVNGAQETFVNGCYLISFIMTMVEDDPNKFAGPALVSFGSVLLCALIYSWFAEESSESAKNLKKQVEEEEERKRKEFEGEQ